MTVYYHAAPLPLSPGSIVQPGNWGRMLSTYKTNQSNGWLLAREFVFETIRVSEAPNRPSRLSSAFVFYDLDNATRHLEVAPTNLLYEVELVQPDALQHRCAYNLLDFPLASDEFIPVSVSRARQYWRGEGIITAEILTASPLRICSLVNGGPAAYQP